MWPFVPLVFSLFFSLVFFFVSFRVFRFFFFYIFQFTCTPNEEVNGIYVMYEYIERENTVNRSVCALKTSYLEEIRN